MTTIDPHTHGGKLGERAKRLGYILQPYRIEKADHLGREVWGWRLINAETGRWQQPVPTLDEIAKLLNVLEAERGGSP